MNELKDEVEMAGSKSIRTRFIGITTSTIHPYACLSCIDVDLFVLSKLLDLHVGEILSPITDGSVLIHCIITAHHAYSYSKNKRRDV